MKYNEYKRVKQLGEGGNGWVYLMKSPSNEEVAVKVSKFKNSKSSAKLERFKIEALKIRELYQNGQRGIIPIKDLGLPCESTGEYFFVMPLAIPLEEKTKNINDIYELVSIFKGLAQVLVELHSQGISHRDLKPDNILYYDGNYCLGDFGLIDFPGKEELTRANEAMGNRKTMAPEMRLPTAVKDHRPADVYSFAKTMWMVIANEEYAFDGQFNYIEHNKLQLKYREQHFIELNRLLFDATYENLLKRPTMEEFLDRLSEWEVIAKDKSMAARSMWAFIEESVVQQYRPSTVMWRDEEQVMKIVKQLAVLNFNHTFIHDGGGLDLLDLYKPDWINENGIIALNLGFNIHVVKLKRLIWESPNYDPRFSYFRLEFDQLEPIYPDRVKALEEWAEKKRQEGNPLFTSPEDIKEYYEDIGVNNTGEYEPYNENDGSTQHVIRWFRGGAFLIVFKSSIYNAKIHSTYDGRHSRLDTDKFREYMEILQYIYSHPILNRYFYTFAELDPLQDDNLNGLIELRTLSDDEIKNEIDQD